MVCYHSPTSFNAVAFLFSLLPYRFMGVCVQEGQLHALTEYIEDGSLEQLIANSAVYLSPLLKIRIALGIARGMQYVHDVGIFHRDLTSKVIFLDRSRLRFSFKCRDAILRNCFLLTFFSTSECACEANCWRYVRSSGRRFWTGSQYPAKMVSYVHWSNTIFPYAIIIFSFLLQW